MGSNDPGFDGTPYNNYWPNSSPTHSTAFLFSSPRTGANFTTPNGQAAFEADLPRIEAADFGGTCSRSTGAGCTNPPVTDDGAPAAFYPYGASSLNQRRTTGWALARRQLSWPPRLVTRHAVAWYVSCRDLVITR
jgi:hypothetical protein